MNEVLVEMLHREQILDQKKGMTVTEDGDWC
jgi:hypothetical protein